LNAHEPPNAWNRNTGAVGINIGTAGISPLIATVVAMESPFAFSQTAANAIADYRTFMPDFCALPTRSTSNDYARLQVDTRPEQASQSSLFHKCLDYISL
jgi:hypothetical protein